MTCPFCQTRFTAAAPARCPQCGCEVMRLTSGLVKTSAVLIASADTRAVYRSVQDVPEPLRRRLMESTQGANSATIVIADHGGRAHMQKGTRDEPAVPPVTTELATAGTGTPQAVLTEPVAAAVASPPAPVTGSRARLAGLALAAAVLAAAAAWLLHGVQW